MAGESTYALITDVLPEIWEAALRYAEHSFYMARLVKLFTDRSGMVPRNVSEYAETAVTDNLGELTDLTPVAFDRPAKGTLTPKEVGKQFLITDRRIESDTEGVLTDAAWDLGYTMGKKVETDLLSLFASLTGGTIGTEDTAFSIAQIFKARAILEAAGVPGPYTAVCHPYHYLDIHTDLTSLSNAAPLDIRNQAVQQYYVTNIADVQLVVASLMPSVAGTDNNYARAALFGRDALALDIRRGFRIEPERDASRRATELNATMIYAAGVWRPERGVIIEADITPPA